MEEQQKSRYGDCFQCGKCCSLLLKCPFLEGPEWNTKCAIYHKGRPKQCEAFPIDHKDLHDVEFLCGYYFNDEVENLQVPPLTPFINGEGEDLEENAVAVSGRNL